MSPGRLIGPALAWVIALACACARSGDGDDAGASSSSQSSTSTSATSAGETSGAVTSWPGTTTTDVFCTDFFDELLAQPVTVTLRNDGAEPVTLVQSAGCEPVETLTIRGPDSVLPIHWRLDPCEATCGAAAQGLCASCPPTCAAETVVILAPGGAFTIVWEGFVYRTQWLSPPCVIAGRCEGPCRVKRSAGAGRYGIEAVGGTEVAGCADPDACTCEPNAEGWCEVSASAVAGTPREASVGIDYTREAEALLIFE